MTISCDDFYCLIAYGPVTLGVMIRNLQVNFLEALPVTFFRWLWRVLNSYDFSPCSSRALHD